MFIRFYFTRETLKNVFLIYRLKECSLTEKCCVSLAALLTSSHLKELDLSDNDLQDSGIELLCAGLASPTCQLEKLRFVNLTIPLE